MALQSGFGRTARSTLTSRHLYCCSKGDTLGDSRRLRGVRGAVRQAESFEDAGQIVGAPAVTQDEHNRHRLRILAHLQSAWRLHEQLLEAVIYVQLFDENLDQGRRPRRTA